MGASRPGEPDAAGVDGRGRAPGAAELGSVGRREFEERYHEPDPEDTADSLPGSRTGGWGDRSGYLYKKLRALAAHFARAAESGEAMLVRIGTRI